MAIMTGTQSNASVTIRNADSRPAASRQTRQGALGRDLA
jgi:hypothetical protein